MKLYLPTVAMSLEARRPSSATRCGASYESVGDEISPSSYLSSIITPDLVVKDADEVAGPDGMSEPDGMPDPDEVAEPDEVVESDEVAESDEVTDPDEFVLNGVR